MKRISHLFGTSAPMVALLTLAACGGTDGAGGSGETGSDADSNTDDGSEGADSSCQVGTEGCPCTLDGICEEGLTCEDEICVAADGTCGDGILDANEECDQGANNDNEGICKEDCTLQVCGDGYVGPGEACDDGNMVDDDECSNDCVLTSCGDGVVQDGEECDDGNQVDDDECTNACTNPVCGDGIVQEGEACDDGNADEEDSCSSACESLPFCGDGVVVPGELCWGSETLISANGASSFDLGEFDGSPGLDLAVGRGAEQEVSFFINDGTGTLTQSVDATQFGVTFAVAIGDVITGDYDADGRDDIAISLASSSRLITLFGAEGTGTNMFRPQFSSTTVSSVLGRGRSYPAPGTQRDDLYMLGPSAAGSACEEMTVYSFDPAVSLTTPVVSGQTDECVVASDVVIGNFDTDASDGGEGYVLKTIEGWASRFDVADTDLGASPDLATTDWVYESILFRPRLATSFQADNQNGEDIVIPEWNEVTCDYASDPGACEGNVVKLFLGQGGVDANPGEGVEFAVGRAPTAVAHGDMNGDGHEDIVVVYAVEARVDLLLGDGAGGFTLAEVAIEGDDPLSYDVAVADLNLDGVPDIVVGNLYTESVSVYLSNP